MRTFLVMAFLAIAVCFSPLAAYSQVTQHELTIPTRQGALPVYSWGDPSSRPRAIIIAMHGSVQNGKYLSAIGKELANAGFLTFAPDFRGHGKWLSGHNGPDFSDIDYAASEEDVRILVKQLRHNYKHVPVYALGESIGAAVAMSAASKDKNLFDGLILCSAGSKPVVNDFKVLARQIKGGIASIGSNIDISDNIGRFISEDERVRLEMMNDPEVHKSSNLKHLLHTVLYLKKAGKEVANLDRNVPVLVLQGAEDKILAPSSAHSLFSQIPSRDKQLKLLPGVGHILVTGNYLKRHVVDVVESWLIAQSNTGSLADARTPQSFDRSFDPGLNATDF